ncbi:katanin-like family protein [Cystoisospora suis]|uniref:Katanin-like family protein n=1 Tax=Cystoisospora suis TaxID=483139 RepID=A0A2C6LEB1_9APIC|nr:katanin-like family protein [Cystoisospora suis]
MSMIEKDILRDFCHVPFDDIAGLDNVKRLLREAVILPALLPEVFTGIRSPWKGVLLFGPPGTGKTLLARAVAAATQWTFFNCSVATLTSKWRGESEKLIRTLFQMARARGPSIVFFDEIDALMSKRGSASEHEASRRAKAELLVQLDGLAGDRKNFQRNSATRGVADSQLPADHVMVLATSNTPWDIDVALRRRLEKRIYTPLPDENGRVEMLRIHMQDIPVAQDVDLKEVASRTELFSGADLHQLCREACMNPLRRLVENLSLEEIQRKRSDGALDEQATQVTMRDFEQALEKANPSTISAEIQKFVDWNAQFGSE